MNTKLKLNFATVIAAAALVCTGCNQNENAPAPTPPPAATNAPAPAPEAPKVEPPAAPKTDTKVLTPEEAAAHIGETATVRGKVFGVHVSQKGDVFMNIGAAHPNAPFTAICFQQAIPTETLKSFNGKTVSIKGKIKEYNGKVEIILESANQISE